MSDIVIKAENIGKSYMIGHQSNERYVALRDVITNNAKRWWSRIRNPQYHTHDNIEEFWALKDVEFEIKRGDRVGIIGRNGAGKSTLLKILSRITEPTTGKLRIVGRVASLLEVGTGFHPELTGRENIYLNGAILGMTKWEVKSKFDEIVNFAGVEKFLDTPVKRFSSGMYVRLAFSVAAHLESEILLVDEVLAVGDIMFQKKCLGKMESVAKEGRTVLFVSHNMSAIQRLCSSAILIENGMIGYLGTSERCIDYYLNSSIERNKPIISHAVINEPTIKLNTVTVNGSTNDKIILPPYCKQLDVVISGTIDRSMPLFLDARIYDYREQGLAFFTPRRTREHFEVFPVGRFCLEESIGLPHLNQGEYILSLYIIELGNNSGKSPVSFEKAIRLEAEGMPTITGQVFKYAQGNGWMLLPGID